MWYVMENMIVKLNNCKKELEAVNEELKALPAGSLVKRRSFYSHAANEKEIGITGNTELIRKLGRKKYLLIRQKQLSNNISVLSRAVNKFDNTTQEKIIDSFPETYQQLPDTYFFHPSIESWQAGSCQRNPYQPEECKYISKSGTSLRSKSELLIANLLEEYGIPYHYDVALKLGNKTIYPDFIIRNPHNGKLIIWEHFGALNQTGYGQKMNDKMDLYMKHGRTPFENLIYTFEFDIRNRHRLEYMIENIIL